MLDYENIRDCEAFIEMNGWTVSNELKEFYDIE